MVSSGHPAFVSSLLLVNIILNHAAVEIKFSLHAAAQSWATECPSIEIKYFSFARFLFKLTELFSEPNAHQIQFLTLQNGMQKGTTGVTRSVQSNTGERFLQ